MRIFSDEANYASHKLYGLWTRLYPRVVVEIVARLLNALQYWRNHVNSVAAHAWTPIAVSRLREPELQLALR
jgi:hypothetical protein